MSIGSIANTAYTSDEYFQDPLDTGEVCPGCDVKITTKNAGGYRTYCEKCTQEFPDFPRDYSGAGYNIIGRYPDFKWKQAG